MSDDRAEAEETRIARTVMAGLVAYRGAGLVTGFTAVLAAEHEYRSRAAARLLVAAATVESLWAGRRLWTHGGTDRIVARVDAVAAIGAVGASRANVSPGYRGTFADWPAWGFAANAIAGQAMTTPRAAPGAWIGAVAIATATSAAISAGAGEFVTNIVAMAGLYAGGALIARQVRQGSQRAKSAQAQAVDEGILLAAEQERARQLRLLHDSALQMLETVAAGRFADVGTMRDRALDEATRLQLELDGRARDVGLLADEIAALAREYSARGLRVDVVVGTRREPSARVTLALRNACNEALTNVAKHAGVQHAVVRLDAAPGGVRIDIEDRGCGFDTVGAGGSGFGTRESIARRLADVGGRAEVRSRVGRGTRVTLWAAA